MKKLHHYSLLLVFCLFTYSFFTNEVHAQYDWQLNGSNIYYDDGNVGVYTSSPARELDVEGASKIIRAKNPSGWAAMEVSAAANTNSLLYYSEGDTAMYELSWYASDDMFVFRDVYNGAIDMVIDASGDLGVGTTTPARELDVIGDAKIIRAYNPNGWAGMEVSAKTGTNSLLNFSEDNTTQYELYWDATNDAFTFRDKYPSNRDDLVIDASGDVGIGTTTPDAELEVEGSNKVLRLTDTSSWVGMELNAASGQRSSLYFQEGGADKYEISWEGGSDYLKFYGSGVTDMVIKDDGKVGIGETAPEALLHIADSGTRNFQIGDDAYFADMDISNGIGIYGDANSAEARLELGTGGAQIYGKSNGDICIGTCN